MKKPALIYNIIALIISIFCILISWVWIYYIALILGLPALVVGLYCCKMANKKELGNKFTKTNYWLFAASVLLSLFFLALFLTRN